MYPNSLHILISIHWSLTAIRNYDNSLWLFNVARYIKWFIRINLFVNKWFPILFANGGMESIHDAKLYVALEILPDLFYETGQGVENIKL